MQWDGTGVELYDLASDGLEAVNVAVARPNVRLQLESALTTWRDEVWPP
jgi:hypothetical protein